MAGVSLVLVVLVAALALGGACGGSLERLGALPLRTRRLVVLALLAQVAGALLGGVAYPVGLGLGALLALAFLARNRGARGAGLVGLGVVANALVVGVNGAMPVSLEAGLRAGVTVQPVLLGQDPRHELLGEQTRLPLLADVVPVPLPLAPQVVSPGDVLVAAGLGQLVLLGMRGGRPGQPAG
jgi:Family of unknown function (DUF5317)